MSLYESIILLRQDLSSGEAEKIADKMMNVITEYEGKIQYKEVWGMRGLAYEINKCRKAYYFMYHIEASPEAIKEIERLMRVSSDFIRFMNIKVKTFEDRRPSFILKDRQDSQQVVQTKKYPNRDSQNKEGKDPAQVEENLAV